MKTNVVKLRFARNGNPYGREYTYYANVDVEVGDAVEVPGGNNGVITQIDVPLSEIEPFKDRAKAILGKEPEIKAEPEEQKNDGHQVDENKEDLS